MARIFNAHQKNSISDHTIFGHTFVPKFLTDLFGFVVTSGMGSSPSEIEQTLGVATQNSQGMKTACNGTNPGWRSHTSQVYSMIEIFQKQLTNFVPTVPRAPAGGNRSFSFFMTSSN